MSLRNRPIVAIPLDTSTRDGRSLTGLPPAAVSCQDQHGSAYCLHPRRPPSRNGRE